jgi:hypothetical protein
MKLVQLVFPCDTLRSPGKTVNSVNGILAEELRGKCVSGLLGFNVQQCPPSTNVCKQYTLGMHNRSLYRTLHKSPVQELV